MDPEQMACPMWIVIEGLFYANKETHAIFLHSPMSTTNAMCWLNPQFRQHADTLSSIIVQPSYAMAMNALIIKELLLANNLKAASQSTLVTTNSSGGSTTHRPASPLTSSTSGTDSYGCQNRQAPHIGSPALGPWVALSFSCDKWCLTI